MSPFIVTATAPNGARDTFARQAESLEHLRNLLEREGFSDIEFVDDEFTARLRSLRPEGMRDPSPAEARLEVQLRKGPAPVAQWLLAMRNNAILLLVNVTAITYGLWSGRFLLAVIGLLLIVWWVWTVRKGMGRADEYNDLLRAQARDDREGARALIDRMAADTRLADNESLQEDLQFRRAGLRAREGQLASALADVEPLRGTAHSANGTFDGRVASLYYQAGDMPGFLQSMEAAYLGAGQSQFQRLDLAFAHARVGDSARAEELMAGLDRRNLSAIHQPIAMATDGLLSLRSGDARAGSTTLEAGVTGFSQFAANPAVWPIHGILLGKLALAWLDANRRDDALALLQPWRDVVLGSADPESRRRLETELSA